MQSGSYIGLLRRWWLVLAVATLAGGVAGWALGASAPPTYRAQARLLVGPIQGDFDTLRAASQLTRTYADLATSQVVLTDAIQHAALPTSVVDLAGRLNVSSSEETRLITIEAEDVAAEGAARDANSVAQALERFVASGGQVPEGAVAVIDPATAPDEPTTPQAALRALLAALAALTFALLVVTAIEFLDDTIRSVDQLRRVGASRAVDIIAPATPRRRRRAAAADEDGRAYRPVLGDLHARAPEPLRSVLVMTAGARSAEADVAWQLVAAGRDIGTRVTLVDATPMSPAESAARRAGAGRLPDHGVRHVREAARFRDLVLAEAELMVVDAGAAGESFASAAWARVVDSIVIAVELGRSRRREVVEALDRIEGAAAPVYLLAARNEPPARSRDSVERQGGDIRPAPALSFSAGDRPVHEE